MGGMFKVVHPDGRIEYTDKPAGPQVQQFRPDGTLKPQPPAKTPAQKNYQEAKEDVALARKYVPKLAQYVDYLDYLRHHSPIRFDRLMSDLQREDPQVWLKLQKYPQFRPLRNAVGVTQAGSNILGAGVGVASGHFSGSVEKWAESTLQDLMKRDGFYADVLGSKATTLATPRRTYSSSRLGQHLSEEVPRAEAASRAVAKDLAAGRAAIRSSAGTAVTRVGGTVLDLEIQLLDPDTAQSGGVWATRHRIETLAAKGVLDDEQHIDAVNLLSQGKYVEVKKLLDDAVKQYVSGR